jgi:hypothetical protein
MNAGSLSSTEVAHFLDEGYLILPTLFAPHELEPLRRELEAQVDRTVSRLKRQGKLADTHAQDDFSTRLARVFEDSRENGEAVMRDIEGVAGGGFTGRAMFDLIRHEKLLGAIESLVGPEIVASSVYRVRPKIPGKVRGVVPWHQDSGYFTAQCDSHLIVTCWVPLVDATAHNGCMKILPRAHRRGVFTHHTGGNANFLVIEDADLPADAPQPVTAEVPLGGVVLMTNLTPHCSTPNLSDRVRWSVDLRYQGAAAPNNVAVLPPVEEPATPQVLMACYPPEADFIVRSRQDPSAVTDYDTFLSRRNHYDAVKHKSYPERHWAPVGTK